MSMTRAERQETLLAVELRAMLQSMRNRDAGPPLRCNEMLIPVEREKLREIMGLALEALQNRSDVDSIIREKM